MKLLLDENLSRRVIPFILDNYQQKGVRHYFFQDWMHNVMTDTFFSTADTISEHLKVD